MTERISALRLFTRVARTGSFSVAGREVGLTQPSVSRIIAGLEGEVGVALLTRNTRAVSLTEAGAAYLARIEPILGMLEEANHEVRGTGELRGVLRIGAATSFAMREIIPRLPPFMDRHPALRVDLILTDSRQDLVTEAVDVALRFGPLVDSTAVARRLGTSPRLLAASPDYLAQAGTPKTPADLADHTVIVGPSGFGPSGWAFKKAGKQMSIRVEGRLTISVNEASTAAAVAGLGIVSTGLWGCRTELLDGRLVRVLEDWEIGDVEVHAVLAAGRTSKPSARAFADYLVTSFKENNPSVM